MQPTIRPIGHISLAAAAIWPSCAVLQEGARSDSAARLLIVGRTVIFLSRSHR